MLRPCSCERKVFIANLLVRIHLITEVGFRTGLAPWEFEFVLSGCPAPVLDAP